MSERDRGRMRPVASTLARAVRNALRSPAGQLVRRLVVTLVLAALVGAAAFGVIHVLGGIWNANPRAVAFGLGLAAVSVALLVAGDRLIRRPGSRPV